MFGLLGTIRFELLSPSSMSDSEKWNYSKQSVLENKPVLQYTGKELIEINLRLAFHHSFCNPAEKLKELKDAANSNEVLTLLWGNGDVAGDFVIEEISRTFEQMDNIGNIMAIAVDVKLVEWSESDELALQKKPLRLINSPKKKDSTVKPDIPLASYAVEKIVRQAD